MPEVGRPRLTAILVELCQAIAADGGAMLYLDDGEGTLQLAASCEPDRHQSRSLVGRLVAFGGHNESLILRLPGSPSGIVVVNRRSGGEFTQQDHAVARLYVRRFSEESGVGVVHLGRSVWTRQLETIQRIAARLTRLASVEEVALTICNEVREVIAYDEAHVLIAGESGGLERVAATGPGPAAGPVAPLPLRGRVGDLITRASQGGVPVLVAEAGDLGGARPSTSSLLLVPLHYETRVTGLVCLVAHSSGRFDDDDVHLLQILSDQAAVAIENARLLHGRDELVHELAGLLEISEAASAAEDERGLATLLAARLRQLLEADSAVVCRWEEGSTRMHVIYRDGTRGRSEALDVADSPAHRAVLRDGRATVVQADVGDDWPETARLQREKAHTLVLVPLSAGGRTIGMIELLGVQHPLNPSDSDLHACEAMAGLAATGLEKIHIVQQLRSAADMDLVTGLHNHRYLQERLRQEVARSNRSHSPLAVLMLDLDEFKPINDRYGHAEGDRVLFNIAHTIRAHVRSSDIVARYGGDEFVVLMPDTDARAADRVARRVVSGILKEQHGLSDGTSVSVGVSAGLAVFPDDGRSSAQLLQAADLAMYTVKRNGGRQVERWSGPEQLDATPVALAG